MKFVDRDRELSILRDSYMSAKDGKPSVVIIEGAAGTGKSMLVDRFLEECRDADIKKVRASESNMFVPHSLFREILGGESIRGAVERYHRERIRQFSMNILREPRCLLVDSSICMAEKVHESLKGKAEMLRLSPRRNGKDVVWLSTVVSTGNTVNPENLEFHVMDRIMEFFKSSPTGILIIDDLNYLIYLNGIDRVVGFLRTLYGMASGKHGVIAFSILRNLEEDERKRIVAIFDDVASIEGECTTEPMVTFVESIGDLPRDNMGVFTNRREEGKHYIGPGGLDPYRIDFEILELVGEEAKGGKDIAVDCLGYLASYHGARKVYTWLKSVADVASMHGRRVYVVRSPQDTGLGILDSLGEIAEGKMDYTERETIKHYSSLVEYLQEQHEDSLRILVLEDLHLADLGSLQLMHYLSRNLKRGKIMLIGTYRAEIMGTRRDASRILASIRMEESVKFIRLQGLSREDMEEMLKSIRPDIEAGEIEEIYEKSEGNPLLAITMATGNLGDIRFLDTIRDSVEAMLNRMSDEALYLLWHLASVGEVIPEEIADELVGEWREIIGEIPRELVEMQSGRIFFRHGVHRDIIYRSAPKDLRRKIHLRIAEIYERHGNIVEAARHYYLARDKKGIKLLEELAEMSREELSIDDAIGHYEKALEIAEKYNLRDEKLKLLERIGDMRKKRGLYRDAIKVYRRLLAENPENPHEVALKMSACMEILGNYDEALKILREHLRESDGIVRGRIAGEIGRVTIRIGNFEEAKLYIGEYMKVARKYESKRDIAISHREMAVILYHLEMPEKAMEEALKALEIAKEIGDRELIGRIYNIVGVMYDELRQYDLALEYYEKALEIAEKIGNYSEILKVYNNIAIVMDYHKGDYQKAREYYEKIVEIARELGYMQDMAFGYNNLAVLESRSGDIEKAIEYGRMAVNYISRMGDWYNTTEFHLNMADFYYHAGMVDKARESAMMALEIAMKKGYIHSIISAYTWFMVFDLDRGDLESAGENLKMAERYINNVDSEYSRLDILSARGEYLLEMRDVGGVRRVLDEAYKIAKELEDPDEIRRLDSLKSRMLCASGNLREALEIAEKIRRDYAGKRKYKWIAEYFRLLGNCLMREGYREEAMESFRKSLGYYRKLNSRRRVEELEEKISELQNEKNY